MPSDRSATANAVAFPASRSKAAFRPPLKRAEQRSSPPDQSSLEATIAEAAKSSNVAYLAGLFDTFMSAVEILKNFRNQPRIYEYEDEIRKGPIDYEIERLNNTLDCRRA